MQFGNTEHVGATMALMHHADLGSTLMLYIVVEVWHLVFMQICHSICNGLVLHLCCGFEAVDD